MCDTWGAIRSTVARRPSSRNSTSSVASYWRIAAPNWKPCVHSVHPRAVYRPRTVNTGAPAAGRQRFSSRRILPADSSNIRVMAGTSAAGVSERSGFRGTGREA